MRPVRLRNLEHDRCERRHAEPVRDLVAKDAVPPGDWAVVLCALTLSGDDEEEAEPRGMAVQHEALERGMGAIEGHAVQVDLGLGAQLAGAHPLVGLGVHAEGMTGDLLAQRRNEGMGRIAGAGGRP
jgi:hypothetical protein